MDVLNPSKTAKPGGLAPAPVDIFAPLAPMPMPANLFVPSSGVCHIKLYLFLVYVCTRTVPSKTHMGQMVLV